MEISRPKMQSISRGAIVAGDDESEDNVLRDIVIECFQTSPPQRDLVPVSGSSV